MSVRASSLHTASVSATMGVLACILSLGFVMDSSGVGMVQIAAVAEFDCCLPSSLPPPTLFIDNGGVMLTRPCEAPRFARHDELAELLRSTRPGDEHSLHIRAADDVPFDLVIHSVECARRSLGKEDA